MKSRCPNCGETLSSYRTDRQAVGQREAVLEWTICPGCRHVALDHWSFGEGLVTDEVETDDEPVPEMHPARRR